MKSECKTNAQSTFSDIDLWNVWLVNALLVRDDVTLCLVGCNQEGVVMGVRNMTATLTSPFPSE